MKSYEDPSKPCNRIVANFTRDITESYNGYITGVPITYQSEDNIEPIIDVLDYNDVHFEDNSLLKDALVYGIAYEVCWVDMEGKQRFRKLSPLETIPVYDNTLEQNLLAVIRYYCIHKYDNTDHWYIEVYDSNYIKKYDSDYSFSEISFEGEEPHYYGQVPITVFELNEEHKAIFDGIMSLQDAYNKLISCDVDNFEAFTDCYLILKNCVADAETIGKMKKNRVLILDEDADASFLTKNMNDTNIENMLDRIQQVIYEKSKAPNFQDQNFNAASGIAMEYRLSGFIFVAGNIIANMKKALQKRIELISSILSLTDSEGLWRSIDIIFTPNLPVDEQAHASEINMLRGLVSDETLLAQLPFIKDPKEELDRLREQKQENISMYDFERTEEVQSEETGE